jgi:hypothetical protein
MRLASKLSTTHGAQQPIVSETMTLRTSVLRHRFVSEHRDLNHCTDQPLRSSQLRFRVRLCSLANMVS